MRRRSRSGRGIKSGGKRRGRGRRRKRSRGRDLMRRRGRSGLKKK